MFKKSLVIAATVGLSLSCLYGCGNSPSADKSQESVVDSKASTETDKADETVEVGNTESEGNGSNEVTRPDDYQVRPISIIVPYSAGGAADIVARAIATVLPDYVGADVTVTNVEGGNGVVGVTQMLSEKNDGYTIAIYASPVFEITPSMNQVKYTLDDFTFLGTVVERPNVLVVPKDAEYNTLDEFFDYAKSHSGMTYGDPAAGSAHLGYVSLLKAAGVDNMTFVPYSGGTGEAITALLGNHIDSAMALPADTYEYIEAGNLKALCVESDERIDILPDVPTAKEQGYDVEIGLTNGFIAPKGLDEDIANYLSYALEQATNDPRILEYDPGDEGLIQYKNGTDTKEMLRESSESFKTTIDELGLASK